MELFYIKIKAGDKDRKIAIYVMLQYCYLLNFLIQNCPFCVRFIPQRKRLMNYRRLLSIYFTLLLLTYSMFAYQILMLLKIFYFIDVSNKERHESGVLSACAGNVSHIKVD